MATASCSRVSRNPVCGPCPLPAARRSLLVPAVRAAEYANFRVTTNGIFYVGVTADQVVVREAPLTGGPGVDVAWLGNYSWPGFAVTPDGITRALRALGSPREQHHGRRQEVIGHRGHRGRRAFALRATADRSDPPALRGFSRQLLRHRLVVRQPRHLVLRRRAGPAADRSEQPRDPRRQLARLALQVGGVGPVTGSFWMRSFTGPYIRASAADLRHARRSTACAPPASRRCADLRAPRPSAPACGRRRPCGRHTRPAPPADPACRRPPAAHRHRRRTRRAAAGRSRAGSTPRGSRPWWRSRAAC